MFTDEWFIERIKEQAEKIRGKMEGGMLYGIKLDEFILKHPDVMLVMAYYIGTRDSHIQWTETKRKDLV
jgi:hypothetical protein